jgi:DNA invertase Pin-like site-specific DNA recombinase
VHVGRTGATLHAESSPYLPLTADAVRAYSAFFNAMCRHRAVQGIKRARAERVFYLYEGVEKPKDGFLPRIAPDAAYRDNAGSARPQLAACLASLKPGDTLYVLRETHLADDFGQAVELLGQLARRGVHVRLGSTGRLVRSEVSPYLRLSAEAAAAIVKFRQAFTARMAREGFQRRIARGERVGRPRSPLPEGFAEARAGWLEGRMSGREAAVQCGMAYSTFAKRARA